MCWHCLTQHSTQPLFASSFCHVRCKCHVLLLQNNLGVLQRDVGAIPQALASYTRWVSYTLYVWMGSGGADWGWSEWLWFLAKRAGAWLAYGSFLVASCVCPQLALSKGRPASLPACLFVSQLPGACSGLAQCRPEPAARSQLRVRWWVDNKQRGWVARAWVDEAAINR
jgi:hypothetical protein